MTMKDYENKFMEILRYMGFIKEEKVKIQRFMGGLLSFYSDKIQLDDLKNLEKAIRKYKHLYEYNKRRWTIKKGLGI